MKKILSLIFILLTLVSTVNADWLSDARQREREAVNGYPGGLVPGYGPQHPMPQLPYPQYHEVYGHGYTVRWQDMGLNRAEKMVETNIHLNASGQFVNELLLTAQDNQVQIRSVRAHLSNGQVIDLYQAVVSLRRDQQLRIRLDNYYSLKINQITLRVISPNLLGSRGKLQVHLGLAY